MDLACTATQHGLSEEQYIGVRGFFSQWHVDGGIRKLNNGGCVGGDEEIAFIAASFIPRIDIVVHRGNTPEKWSKRIELIAVEVLDPRPNLERNRVMVDVSSHLLACPGTEMEVIRSGTWATIRYARDKVMRPTTIIYPSGEVEVWN